MSIIMGEHKPELDQMTPAMIRVVCEHLLYTMRTEQRQDLMKTLPGLYAKIYPETKDSVKHGHGTKRPEVADRSQFNWCSECKDWFLPKV